MAGNRTGECEKEISAKRHVDDIDAGQRVEAAVDRTVGASDRHAAPAGIEGDRVLGTGGPKTMEGQHE